MSIHRRTFSAMLAGLGLSSLPAWAQAKTVDVSMTQSPKMRFVPETLTIKAGDTVKWTNPHNISHTVTFDPSKAAVEWTAATGDLLLVERMLPESWAGRSLAPLTQNGSFLADGDEVVLRGTAGDVELGEVRGRVLPSA